MSLLLGALWVAPLWPFGDASFRTADDWYHLNVAATAATGDPQGWAWLIRGAHVRSWRVVPNLLWLLEWSVWGLRPGPYFVTNHVLGGALVAGVALLAGRLSLARHGDRGGRTAILASVVAGTLVGCAAQLHELRWFLSARDDTLAALLLVIGLLLWLEHRRRTACVALALALLCKPTALLGLALVPLLDLALGRRGDAGYLRRYRALLAVGTVYLAATGPSWLGWLSGGPRPLTAGLTSWPSVEGVASIWLYGASPPPGLLASDPAGPRLGLLVAAGLVFWTTRDRPWRVVGFGLAWAAIAAVPALLYPSGLDDAGVVGRYLVVSMAGWAVAVSALVGPGGPGLGRLPRVGALVALLTAASLGWVAWLGSPPRTLQPTSADRLQDALEAELAARPGTTGSVVALSYLDPGLLGLLTSEAIRQDLGPAATARFYLQGTTDLFAVVGEPHSADPVDRARRVGAVDLDALAAEVDTLVLHDENFGSRFLALTELPATHAPAQPPPQWDHPTALEQAWGGTRLRGRPERGALIAPPRAANTLRAGVSLEASSVCGLRVSFVPPTWPLPAPSHWQGLMERPAWLALTWTSTAGGHTWGRYALAPLRPGAGRVRFDLRNSPGWRTSGQVTELVLGHQLDGDLELLGVEMEACRGD